MNNLQHSFVRLVERHRTGSKTTQANRGRILRLAAAELYALGLKPQGAEKLRPVHIEALVNHWLEKKLTPGTIKNRMSGLRWVVEKVNRLAIIPRENSALGIPRRVLTTNEDKSRSLDERLQSIPCEYVRFSLRLQAAFGLRREESIKFQPNYADRGDQLVLKPSWTKGAVPRSVSIRTDEQRTLIKQIRLLVGAGSLIPPYLRYIDQQRRYDSQVTKAGFDKMHGLRHAYAQTRYVELTGWLPPVKGGARRQTLDEEQRAVDKRARSLIAAELGHKRLSITNCYLGS